MTGRSIEVDHPRSISGQTALVTGGAGFLGSHICDRLLAEGHNVVCIDSLITGNIENIRDLLDNPRFSFQQADVTEPIDVPGPVDYVLSMASPASPRA